MGDPEKAAGQCKYMRNKFPFFGISAAPLKKLVAEAWESAECPLLQLTAAQLEAVLMALLHEPKREMHYAATHTAQLVVEHQWKRERKKRRAAAKRQHSRRAPTTSGADPPVDVSASFLRVLKQMVQTCSWWDTVDSLAKTVGYLVQLYPELEADMEAWSKDEDFWVRRVSLLHQLAYKEDTDTEALFRRCAAMAHEEEFFIRKAIGWALRQHSRTDPTAVREFVEAHPELSALSKREALKYC